MKPKCPDCKGELEEVFTEYMPDQSRVISYEPRYKCPTCHQEYIKEELDED